MKKLIPGFVMLVAMLSMNSCSKTIYTHEQVMQNYHNKQDVINRFGMPDEKREAQGNTEWVYNGDLIAKESNSTAITAVDTLNAKTITVDRFTDYTKYVKFTFDAQGTVLKSESHGVSLAKRKANPVGTVLVVAGSVAAVVLVLGAIINLDNLQLFSGY